MPVALPAVALSLDVVSKSGTLSEWVGAFVVGQASLRFLKVGQDVEGLVEGG